MAERTPDPVVQVLGKRAAAAALAGALAVPQPLPAGDRAAAAELAGWQPRDDLGKRRAVVGTRVSAVGVNGRGSCR
jgi:hypothetical protein